MKNYVAIIVIAVLFLVACAGGVDRQRSTQQEANLAEANAQIGMPAIVSYQEMRIVKQLYELRDKEIATYAYLQAMDGSLRCLGETLGYGVPYGAQFTNPENVMTGKPQAEPNGLFMPDNAAATWIMLRDPTTGKVSPAYVEPNLIVSQFKLPCKPL